MKIKLHPRPNSKLDTRIEQAAEGFNQGCVILVWLSCAALLFLYNAPAQDRYKPASHVSQRELSENDYVLIVGDSRKGGKPSKAEVNAIDSQFAMQTRESDVEAMKPKARARYYASMRGDIFSVVRE